MTHRSHLALGGAMFGAALAFTVAADAAPLLDQGKLLLTGGVTNVEGAAGGGIATWATITGYGTNDGIGGNVHATYADVRDYRPSASTTGSSCPMPGRISTPAPSARSSACRRATPSARTSMARSCG